MSHLGTYSQPLVLSYTTRAAALDTSGEIINVAGPAGYVGRLIDVAVNVTVEVTGSDTTLQVGSADDADAYGTLAVPATAADGVVNGATVLTDDDNLIPADGEVVVTCDGGATAGDGTVTLVIAWFKVVAAAS